MSAEHWRPVLGGRYEVSDLGRVRSMSGRPLKPFLDSKGYPSIKPSIDGVQKILRIHRLVAAAFLGESDRLVRHLNDVRHDNRLENLAYGDMSSNVLDSVRNGTHANATKTHCPQGHPYDEANTYAGFVGQRTCRSCNRAAVARYKQRRRQAADQ